MQKKSCFKIPNFVKDDKAFRARKTLKGERGGDGLGGGGGQGGGGRGGEW